MLAAEQYAELGTFLDGEVAPGVHGAVTSGFFLVDGERVGYRSAAPALGDGRVAVDGQTRRADHPTSSGDAARRPFAGLRVLDFGVAGAAPEIARLLGEYGADVIRVESPHRPDLFRQPVAARRASARSSPRRTAPSAASPSTSDEPEGIELVKRLAARADLVVENLPPGTMDRWGLGYEHAARRQPASW